MAYEQRQPPPQALREVTDELWAPEEVQQVVSPDVTDSYAVIDELADAIATISSAPWPHLDKAGRLNFSDEPPELVDRFSVDADLLQGVINTHRANVSGTDEEVANRPLRIGDTFLVRAYGRDPGSWELVADVTMQARTAAKIALYGAVAPRVSEDRAEELGLTPAEPPVEPPPAGPVGAAPAV
jgi:hypothetical protein